MKLTKSNTKLIDNSMHNDPLDYQVNVYIAGLSPLEALIINFHGWLLFTPYELITLKETFWHIDHFKIIRSLLLLVNLLTSITSTDHLGFLIKRMTSMINTNYYNFKFQRSLWEDYKQIPYPHHMDVILWWRLPTSLLCDHSFWLHTIGMKLNFRLKIPFYITRARFFLTKILEL